MGHVVVKAVTDDSWIQVRESDGQLVVSRLLHQGETYAVPDRSGLTLTTGNAGTLQVSVDGKAIPSLGSSKQVKHDISLDPAKLLKRLKPESAEQPAPAAIPEVKAEAPKDTAAKDKAKEKAKDKPKDKDTVSKPKPAADQAPAQTSAVPAPVPTPAPAPAAVPPVPASGQ